MSSESFKWKHYQAEIILLCVRWYLKYPLSYRNSEEMMQDYRFIKKLIIHGLGVKSFKTARWTLKGIEALHMIKKGQIENLNRDALSEVEFINGLFDLGA